MLSNVNNTLNKAMTEEQFTQIVDAIINGKYSWACVLVLKFAGYNPLHYIPYRTFNRLIKEHGFPGQPVPKPKNALQCQQDRLSQDSSYRPNSRIRDLAYLEPLSEQHPPVEGGQGCWRHLYGEEYFFGN